MRQLFIGFLIVAALVVGGGLIANTAYQAGLTTAVTTVAADAPDGTVVVPVAPGGYPAYGYGPGPWGWGHGFSIWGFLGTLFAIFLIVGLIRVIAFGGRRGRGGWGGPGWGGRGGGGRDAHPWQRQARSTFDTWHLESHSGEGASVGSTGPTKTGDAAG